MDYQFIALMICSLLGWSLQQVLNLTWPQFEYISLQLYRLQYQRAKNEIHFGICAAMDSKNRKTLLGIAGDLFMDEPETDLTYTKEELDAAMAKADEIAAQNAAAEAKEQE